MAQVSALLVVLLLLPSVGIAEHSKSTPKRLTQEARLAFIRRAQVWVPTDVPSMDLRAGPQGRGAFPPDAVVSCDYVPVKLGGSSRKFECAIDETDLVKVRYGAANGEIQGSVLASRLLWALGFGADRVYPVRIECHGCPPDPWKHHDRVDGTRTFEPAVIERTPAGHELKAKGESGWAWPELNLVEQAQGGASRAEADALTLLAVFMQHTDSKPEQQRLWCLPGGTTGDGVCEKPFLMIHDVGLTFGRGTYSNNTDTSSVNFEEWAKTPVWKDAGRCFANLGQSHTGTLGDPKISEAGRAFLAGLLAQLTDDQLRDLFDVAQVVRRTTSNGQAVGASVEKWVNAFTRKRDEIIANHCRN